MSSNSVRAYAPPRVRKIDGLIAFCLLRVRIERMRRLVRLLCEERKMATPLLDSLDEAYNKLEEGLEFRAQKRHERIAATDARANATFERLDAHHKSTYDDKLDRINKKLDAVDGLMRRNDPLAGRTSIGSSNGSTANLPPPETFTEAPVDGGLVDAVISDSAEKKT